MALAKNTAAKAASAPKNPPAKATAAKSPAPAPKATKAPEPVAEVPKIGRKELAAALRAKVVNSGCAISQKVSEIIAGAYDECITEALVAGQEVNLPGFGKFQSIHKVAAERHNPATGEKVVVAAHNVPKFKPGSKLKEAVNGGSDPGGEE